MKVFGALLSPFVFKVALVAAEKGLVFELAPFRDREGFFPEFLACSPFHKIPAIDDAGFTLCDSTAIVTYLDAKHPSHGLIPADPKARGQAIWFDEFADTILAASGLKILFHRLVGPKILKVGGDEAIAVQGEKELPPILDYLETVAPAEGWLLGHAFTLADISVAAVLRTLTVVGHGPSPAYPRTLAWYERVAARPTWSAVEAMDRPPA